MIRSFKTVRQTLPEKNIYSMYYEDMLDQDMRMNILSNITDFIGKRAIVFSREELSAGQLFSDPQHLAFKWHVYQNFMVCIVHDLSIIIIQDSMTGLARKRSIVTFNARSSWLKTLVAVAGAATLRTR